MELDELRNAAKVLEASKKEAEKEVKKAVKFEPSTNLASEKFAKSNLDATKENIGKTGLSFSVNGSNALDDRPFLQEKLTEPKEKNGALHIPPPMPQFQRSRSATAVLVSASGGKRGSAKRKNGVMNASSGAVSNRTRTACVQCKRAKTRCNDERPCQRCRKRGNLNCVDAVPRRLGRKRIHHFVRAVSEKELERLKRQQSILDNPNFLRNGSQQEIVTLTGTLPGPGTLPKLVPSSASMNIPGIVNTGRMKQNCVKSIANEKKGSNESLVASTIVKPSFQQPVQFDPKAVAVVREGIEAILNHKLPMAMDRNGAVNKVVQNGESNRAGKRLRDPLIPPALSGIRIPPVKRSKSWTVGASNTVAASPLVIPGSSKKDDTSMGGLQALLRACDAERKDKKNPSAAAAAAAAAAAGIPAHLIRNPKLLHTLTNGIPGMLTQLGIPTGISTTPPTNHLGGKGLGAPGPLPMPSVMASKYPNALNSTDANTQALQVPLAQPLQLPTPKWNVGYVGPRKRLKNACVNCKADKVKCQAARPCARCTRMQVVCIDSIPKRVGRRRIC